MADAINGRWSYSVGERGRNRVRAFAHPETGRMHLEYYEPARTGERPKVRRLALGHSDKELAKEAAEKLAAELRRSAPPAAAKITLRLLFENYLREVTPGKSAGTQQHDRMCVEMFTRAFGRDREPNTLSLREWNWFIRQRRDGMLRPRSVEEKRTVRNRVIAHDLKFLLAVLNWATLAGDGKGGYLLDRNPLKGLPVPREENPSRAILTIEQYQRLLAAAAKEGGLVECFVKLAWHTGHRSSSIRNLRWSDVDLEGRRIHWRGENDKIGLDHWNPLHSEVVEALTAHKTVVELVQNCPSSDEWVFPAPRDPSKPMPRETVHKMWIRLATAAKLPVGQRLGWHSFRRAFSNRLHRSGAPFRDLQDLGGWKSPKTLTEVYLLPDEEAQRRALEGAESEQSRR
ncbi:MAG: tyrosine-type recombinase/integrase [Gemmatimonadaceae bacterium]